ncbi:MAG: MlaD family protein [Saprospiraceae bacterium]
MKLSYELRIGLLAATTLIILIIGYKFLKGNNLFDDNKTYLIVFDDVDQLVSSAPVLTRGLKVGTVVKVKLAPKNPDKVVVTINVKSDILLPKNAKAVLVSTGILEGKAIELRFDHHCSDDCIENGGTINSEVESMLNSMLPKSEMEEYVQVLSKSFKKAFDSTDSKGQVNIMANDFKTTLHNLNLVSTQLSLLMAANTKQISSTISGFNTLAKSLAANSKAIDQSLNNMVSITDQIKNSKIDKLAQNSNQTIQSLNKAAQDATQSMKNINELISQIQNGNGTASKLIKDPNLYNNLESTSKNLDKLLIDMRANPGRYVHFSVFSGKKDKSEIKQ